jgi:MbtH protein
MNSPRDATQAAVAPNRISSTADDLFTVVVNHEAQYAIWPAAKPPPKNWRSVGISGSSSECLAYVERIWGDMRPLSVRTRHTALGLK